MVLYHMNKLMRLYFNNLNCVVGPPEAGMSKGSNLGHALGRGENNDYVALIYYIAYCIIICYITVFINTFVKRDFRSDYQRAAK